MGWLFSITGFVPGFLYSEFPETEMPEPAGQLLEFLTIMLVVFLVAVTVLIVVSLYRSWRLRRLTNPMKEYIRTKKH